MIRVAVFGATGRMGQTLCRLIAETQDLHENALAKLEEKLTSKHEVISELMEENVKAKKANGEL